ncbi:hypothetical protein SLI_4398 [Streptomyces lividans 1326]|uniref:Uncharacterized protein n=1 Tax=Streptomyces lividans 1326 TaxID=1200984 RepID=A0A7U9DS30_STRLI|nr:hypothetical protein SLI_4398 [Streptomyces lividans 1326]
MWSCPVRSPITSGSSWVPARTFAALLRTGGVREVNARRPPGIAPESTKGPGGYVARVLCPAE